MIIKKIKIKIINNKRQSYYHAYRNWLVLLEKSVETAVSPSSVFLNRLLVQVNLTIARNEKDPEIRTR